MSLSLDQKLKIRSMIYVAAEPVPFFWPMRSFIHHNPLHGLEHMPFAEAAETGSKLFHGRAFLPRTTYQDYLAKGRVDSTKLESIISDFVKQQPATPSVNLQRWLTTLLTETKTPVTLPGHFANAIDVHSALAKTPLPENDSFTLELFKSELRQQLLGDRPVYEAVDALYGSDIGNALDELVVKSCLDFFDEGQSVWAMPKREKGFFSSWRDVACRNVRLFLRGIKIKEILDADDTPEGIISYVLQKLEVPQDQWMNYFTRELARLHGWAGFIRWRSNAKHYHWTQTYPGDLVDFIAVRMTLALALLQERAKHNMACTQSAIDAIIEDKTKETYLRHELNSGKILPAMAHNVDVALSSSTTSNIEQVFDDYIQAKRRHVANRQAKRLLDMAQLTASSDALKQLSQGDIDQLLKSLRDFEKQEGMTWLQAMESHVITKLLDGIVLEPPVEREKRPFAQIMFCIDTRSERIRRHLESVGDYQTYGIAGFFGVPVSFMELGKGSENHLCPVILMPKNLVLEVTTAGLPEDAAAVTALEKALHELKESVVTPFVTVEAIGLLFGLDMIGKTIAPKSYNTWRKRINPAKPPTLLLLDKLSREQADSVVRTVQRALIIKAAEQELSFQPEQITDDMVRGLREHALGHEQDISTLAKLLGIDVTRTEELIQRLRDAYRINASFAQMQLEQLGRIGFSLDEQTNFVAQALSAIGLTKGFSRFILIAGHGSSSENNPYESALDCGACGGNHGVVSARVIAQMGNKAEVRRRLREQGIDIPDDAWFVPALHNTTTDEIKLFDLDQMPPSHLFYLDRLRNGLVSASHLCSQERLPTLQLEEKAVDATASYRESQRNSLDWSQVRPEWGLSRNAYFIIGRRDITQQLALDGRAFLHSYDYKVDPKLRLLENIITGPLVVGQWINMEHYFSAVDNERFGSGSKAYHNVAGRFGVMTGNLSDLRTGLPSQTVLNQGMPYHDPVRLITVIEAPLDHAKRAIDAVVSVKHLVRNGWIRLIIIDPETNLIHTYENDEWHTRPHVNTNENTLLEESRAS